MQHDELIWETIHKSCSFRKIFGEKKLFCRNEYNVTGLCNRPNCPLANSRYATVREENARCYLYIKTVERAHSPKRMWTKIKLSRNYQKALKQIDSGLKYWPEKMIHRNKQRLTRLVQSLLRIKKLSAMPLSKIVPLKRNVEKVDRKREARAETVARIENAIEDELLKRLQSGTYGGIYNFPLQQYNEALEREVKKARQVDVNAEEFEEAYESVSEMEEEVEYLEDVDFEESDVEIEDLDTVDQQQPSMDTHSVATDCKLKANSRQGVDHDVAVEERKSEENESSKRQRKPSKKRKKPRIELEMEEEPVIDDLLRGR